ncbi:hypothetical protein HGRIS_011549 [Hohenbuehelia grisea]|uniref:NADH dehydrogenase [ubiquinone] iron-sulfur protein 5 n=1 Tax=Hohenbuehelia grisea TaxID=104357 RepID=A0ABR3JWT7_9AGAR
MASGFGFSGGTSRCFAYWQEFSKCYAQASNPTECRPQSEDYLECLHRPKEIARAKAVRDEYVRQMEHKAKEDSSAADSLAAGTIVGVGIINRGKDENDK